MTSQKICLSFVQIFFCKILFGKQYFSLSNLQAQISDGQRATLTYYEQLQSASVQDNLNLKNPDVIL